MSLKRSPRHERISQDVKALKQNQPFCNYEPAVITTSDLPSEESDALTQGWTGPRGYGGRHKHDQAPFSLWDEAKWDFRGPTSSETSWIATHYHATTIEIQFPLMIIETEIPPEPLPLTVAGVATKFVAPKSEPVTLRVSGRDVHILDDTRPHKFPTNYAGMRGPPDPLPFAFRKWVTPQDDQLQLLINAICEFCNPRMVHIMCPRIIVEISCDDDRTYEDGSMPRRIAGFAVHYYHCTESAFPGLSGRGRERLIQPSNRVEDDTNYLQILNELCPGVRVSSGIATDSGTSAETLMATTAGLLVRNSHGQQRLTVANHGFLDSKDVFHPSTEGTHIGEIDERFEHLDIALVKLHPSVNFTNKTYFEVKAPRRLLRGVDIPQGAFFAVDGMSTGLVFMQAHGLSMEIPPRPPNVEEIKFFKMTLCRGFGALGAVAREGICGAAFVEDDSEEGGVAGFFQNGNGDYAMSPCLDELIDRSWEVV